MHKRQLMYLHKYRPWSCEDACIKVNERFECIKLSVCVSLWQTETLKPAQTSWLGTDINLTLAMFHLALTKCDIHGVALKISTNNFPISFMTLSNELGIQLSCLWYFPRKKKGLKDKFLKKLCPLLLSYWAFWTNRQNYMGRYRMKERMNQRKIKPKKENVPRAVLEDFQGHLSSISPT